MQECVITNHNYEPTTRKGPEMKLVIVKWIVAAASFLLMIAFSQTGHTRPPKRAMNDLQWIMRSSNLDEKTARTYLSYINDSASYHGVDKRLLLGIVLKESTFKRTARGCSSRKPCIGLMQVMVGIHDHRGRFRNLGIHHPKRNIDLGASILRYELEKCAGNARCAVEQYNRSRNKRRYATIVLRYANSIPRV